MYFHEVDEINHSISFEVKIPFGVIVREIISCTSENVGYCRITYDSESILPRGLKVKLMNLFLSKSFTNSIKKSLHRLKTTAEERVTY